MTRLAIVKPASRYNSYKEEIRELSYIKNVDIPPVFNSNSLVPHERKPNALCSIRLIVHNPSHENLTTYTVNNIDVFLDNIYQLEMDDMSDYLRSTSYNKIIDLDSDWAFEITPKMRVRDYKVIESTLLTKVYNHNIEYSLGNLV